MSFANNHYYQVNLLITFCGDATKGANNVVATSAIGSSSVVVTSSTAEPVKVAPTSSSTAATSLKTSSAAAASPKTSSPTTASSVPTSSTTPNRKTCRNARRSADSTDADGLPQRAGPEARALYNVHEQVERAHVRRHKAARHH